MLRAGWGLLALLTCREVAAEPGPSLALYFPPVPPALDTVITRPSAVTSPAPPDAAPSELTPYVSDSFYVPLSAQFSRHEIGSDLSFALQSYLATKNALQTELHARLDSLRESDPEVRIAELQKFAADQTPRLVELEKTAEALRQSIAGRSAAHREFVRWSVDSMGPHGIKTNPPGFDVRQYEIQTEMMIAGFANGPNPAQRRVLRELAGEAKEPTGTPGAWAFLPAGARVSLAPSDPVTPDLQRQIAEYVALDRRLKTDVRSLLLTDRRFDAEIWIAAAPREAELASELETRAEAIRRVVVKFKDPALLPQVPTVPQSMAAQLARHRADKAALQKAVLQLVEAAKKAGPPESAPERIQQAIAKFTAENQAKYDELDRDRDRFHDQLSQLAAAPPGTAGSSTETLTRTFNQSLKQLQTFWDYRDYQAAVFQPGLSPEQRRLLFDGALLKLHLTLPGAIHPVP